jgi:hypothetical protein
MPPWRRVHIINHLDNVFPGERHHVAPSWVFVKFCTPGEGPQDHETLHHVIVLEFVPDGVLLVWAGLLKLSLEVVCRWLRLMFAAVHGSRDAPHIGATCLFDIAVIIVGDGRGPLRMLLVPLLSALGSFLGVVGDDVGWCLLVTAWCCLPAS